MASEAKEQAANMFPEDIYEDGDYKKLVPRYNKTNTLLVRAQLGKVKASTYDLPDDSFVYGQQEVVQEAGTAGAVNAWMYHEAKAGEMPGRDYVRLNKYAAMNGVTTAKHTAAFRAVNDIRQPPANQPAASNIYFPPPETTFGRPSPAPGNFTELLQNKHQRKWVEETRQKHAAEINAKLAPKRKSKMTTKASIGHSKVAAPEPKPLFKMKQFDNVESRALKLAGLSVIGAPNSSSGGGGGGEVVAEQSAA